MPPSTIKNKYQPQVVTYTPHLPTDINSFAKNNWKEVLSDHAPQMMPMTKDIHILIWNIMTLGHGRNNAYQKKEDPILDYEPRLSQIAQELGNQIKLNLNIAVAALQEVPNNNEQRVYFFDRLRTHLPKGWQISDQFYLKAKGSNFGMLTLYDATQVADEPVVLTIPEMTYQKGRIFAIHIIFQNAMGDKKPITVVNGHFRYADDNHQRLSVQDTQTEIDAIFKSILGQVVIAADFNQSLEKVCPKYPDRCYASPGRTSLSYNATKQLLYEKNIDGFIFKYEPENYDFSSSL